MQTLVGFMDKTVQDIKYGGVFLDMEHKRNVFRKIIALNFSFWNC